MYANLTADDGRRVTDIVKELTRRGFSIENVVLHHGRSGSGKLVVKLSTPQGIAFSVDEGSEEGQFEVCRIVQNDSGLSFEKQDRFHLAIQDPFVEGSDDVEAIELVVEELRTSYSETRKGILGKIQELTNQLGIVEEINAKLR